MLRRYGITRINSQAHPLELTAVYQFTPAHRLPPLGGNGNFSEVCAVLWE